MQLSPKEFEYQFRCLYRPLNMSALRYPENLDDAEDIVQQAFSDEMCIRDRSTINPDDIAQITLLKGASAAALYGAVAANGAIMITTKSAQSGKAVSYTHLVCGTQTHCTLRTGRNHRLAPHRNPIRCRTRNQTFQCL